MPWTQCTSTFPKRNSCSIKRQQQQLRGDPQAFFQPSSI